MAQSIPRQQTQRWISEIRMAMTLSDHCSCYSEIMESSQHGNIQHQWNSLIHAYSKCLQKLPNNSLPQTTAIVEGTLDYNTILINHCQRKRTFNYHKNT